jgi:RNA polymerase sigma-70 factor (ECF subfamily)
MLDVTDEQLMQRFASGDQDAFHVLFDKYKDRIFRYILRAFEPDADRAADLTQDVFLRVITGRGSFDPARRFAPWLYAIARNVAINRFHGSSEKLRRRTISLDEAPTAAPDPAAPDLAVAGELSRFVDRSVDALSEPYREVFLLRELEGLSYDEIADTLGLTPGAARTAAHRARAMLRERLSRILEA